MTATDQPPVTLKYNDFMGIKPALTYFPLFDKLRDAAPFHIGDPENGAPDFVLLTRMQGILEAYQNADVFSNSAVMVTEPDPQYKWIPEMLDPPEHTRWRQLLSVFFTPGAVNELDAPVRQRANEIIDSLVDKGQCDFAEDFALRFPNSIFMDLMGLPQEDTDQFMEWEHAILHTDRSIDPEYAIPMKAMGEVMGYFMQLIEKRRQDPQKDILSAALGWQIDGKDIPLDDILALCLLLFMGGLDTVATQLSYTWLHLATHPEDRARINADFDLIPTAIEEMLRYYAFATPARKCMKDTVVAGCPIKAGQMVWLPLSSANRDPGEFPDADKVIIDRESNRHIAFGAGPHRCLGSHLARRELKIAMEEWHKRIPDYRIAPGAEVTEHGIQIGLISLPLVWDV